MSQENVKIVRRAVEAIHRGDLDAALEAFDSEVEWEETASLGPDAQTYRGIAAVREAVGSWLGMWNDYEVVAQRIVAADDRVVVLTQERARGKASGVVVDRELGVVHTLCERRIVRSRLYGSHAEALEAAGLSE